MPRQLSAHRGKILKRLRNRRGIGIIFNGFFGLDRRRMTSGETRQQTNGFDIEMAGSLLALSRIVANCG